MEKDIKDTLSPDGLQELMDKWKAKVIVDDWYNINTKFLSQKEHPLDDNGKRIVLICRDNGHVFL